MSDNGVKAPYEPSAVGVVAGVVVIVVIIAFPINAATNEGGL